MAKYLPNEAAVAKARKLIDARQYRAAEWRHKDIELAAHDLLRYLDKKTGLKPARNRTPS
jgi:hypothetical protein